MYFGHNCFKPRMFSVTVALWISLVERFDSLIYHNYLRAYKPCIVQKQQLQ